MKKLFMILMLLPIVSMAGAEYRMFKYECEQVNPKTANFTCKIKDGLKLRIIKKKTDLTLAQRKRAKYEWDRITTNYLKVGGHGFDVTAKFWPKNAVRQCGKVHNRIATTCTDYLIQKDGSFKEVK